MLTSSSCILESLSEAESPHYQNESEGHELGSEGTNLSAVRVVLERCQSPRYFRLITAILTPMVRCHGDTQLSKFLKIQIYPPENDYQLSGRGAKRRQEVELCVILAITTTKRYRRIRIRSELQKPGSRISCRASVRDRDSDSGPVQ